jgi:hypothetical protein
VEFGALSLSLFAFCGGLEFLEGLDIGFCLSGVLSGKDVVSEQRIGVSHTPISGGGEVQGVCAQVSLSLSLSLSLLLFVYANMCLFVDYVLMCVWLWRKWREMAGKIRWKS